MSLLDGAGPGRGLEEQVGMARHPALFLGAALISLRSAFRFQKYLEIESLLTPDKHLLRWEVIMGGGKVWCRA